MQNFLGTCLAVGVIAGGFALTGDLQRLASRGMRALQATGIPDDDAPVPVTAPRGDPAPATATPAPPPPVTGRRAHEDPARVDLAAVKPGERVLAWLGVAADPACIDVVDPASGAVILHRGAPRRGTIPGGAIVCGEPLRIVPLGVAHAGAPATAESLGVVTGIHVGR